jgi:hypothetical protein
VRLRIESESAREGKEEEEEKEKEKEEERSKENKHHPNLKKNCIFVRKSTRLAPTEVRAPPEACMYMCWYILCVSLCACACVYVWYILCVYLVCVHVCTEHGVAHFSKHVEDSLRAPYKSI